MSVLSSISGAAVHLGLFSGLLNSKSDFEFSDETGTIDDCDFTIIPRWLYEECQFNASRLSSSFDDSSLHLQHNLGCIIEKPSQSDDSFGLLIGENGTSKAVPSKLDYIKVFIWKYIIFDIIYL